MISADKISKVVARLCISANIDLRRDVFLQLEAACRREKNKRTKDILQAIIQNARVAAREGLAICQDTGLPCVFVEIGQEVRVAGDLKAAIIRGVASGYKKGYLRSSMVKDPLLRDRPGYLPPVIHIDLVKGSKLKLTVLPKGFGCENKARLQMFKPTAKINEIKKFVIEVIKDAGPDACPPYIVGVGIGGTADYACFLAKKALLKKITNYQLLITNYLSKLEQDLLKEINKLNIGPMGLGGRTTALAVNILTYPTHIAGLPVAVNISCHALRSATKTV